MSTETNPFKILRHRLYKNDGTAVPFKISPNKSGKVDARYLVIHYTASPSATSSINWFSNKNARASAHLVIDLDGSITQMVPFDIKAWHAGRSSWEGLSGLNQYSIGIEIVNAGKLEKFYDKYHAWFGTTYETSEVLEAVHKHETAACGWQIYPQPQLDAALQVSQLLVRHYNLLDVLGHEDIAPLRKTDPGPAFPMASFKSAVLGRSDDDEIVFETTTHLNIRKGPGTDFVTIINTPLPPQTAVHIFDFQGNWRFVDVLAEINGIKDLQGWVHGRYLKRKE